jgi:hypothetical protein
MSPNAALGRFSGSVAFCLTGYATCELAERLFGLSTGFLDAKWGPRETLVVGVMALVSMLGGLIGLSLGLQVSAGNKELVRLATILWHFFANGQLVCFFLLAVALSRDHRKLGLGESVQVFGTFAAASIVTGLVLFITRQFKEDGEPRPLLWVVIVVPATVWAGLQLQGILQWQPRTTVIFGIVTGLFNVFVSARLIQRDYLQMRELNNLAVRR